jgi:hypothetical protein
MSWGNLHRQQAETNRLLREVVELLEQIAAELLPPVLQATSGTISIGADMATATFSFTPTNGTLPGDGSGLVFTFSAEGTSSVGSATEGTDADGNTNFTAPVTVVDDGSVTNFGGTLANVSGVTPLLDTDSVTEFVQPIPFAFTAPAAPAAQATTGTITVA